MKCDGWDVELKVSTLKPSPRVHHWSVSLLVQVTSCETVAQVWTSTELCSLTPLLCKLVHDWYISASSSNSTQKQTSCSVSEPFHRHRFHIYFTECVTVALDEASCFSPQREEISPDFTETKGGGSGKGKSDAWKKRSMAGTEVLRGRFSASLLHSPNFHFERSLCWLTLWFCDLKELCGLPQFSLWTKKKKARREDEQEQRSLQRKQSVLMRLATF